MTLVQSWIDSLALLKPKNAQLFIMVTIKSIIEAYKIMFHYWWWLMGLLVACYILPIVLPTPIWITSLSVPIIPFLLYQMIFLAICFATRPSIMKKDWSYFGIQYKKIIIYWLSLPILMWVLLNPFGILLTHLVFYLTSISAYLLILPITIYWFFVGLSLSGSIFLVLFFADSSGGPKNFLLSAWNALKMIIFSLPLLLIIGIFFQVSAALISQLMLRVIARVISDENSLAQALWIMFMVQNILASLLLPIGVCFYANIYIKKLHDQFDLYFPRS
jgi:hypothetical protein